MSRTSSPSASNPLREQGDIMTQVRDRWANYVEGSVWFYQPNKVAPLVFAVLFAISGCIHAWQTQKYKSWKMTLLIPWGAFLMSVGFIMREVGAFHIDGLGLLIASIVLTFSGPPVYAAADYFILGRTLYYLPWLSPIYPGRIVQMFVSADIIIEILVANGASKMANTTISDTERTVGQILVKVALLLQAVMFTIYVAILAIWHRRVLKRGLLTRNLRSVVWTMYTSATLITVRCIFRVVEFFQGYTGELYTHEAYFYVFEATLMLLNSALLNIFHPGRFFPPKSKVYLSTDGVTELKGPGWSDSRRWYIGMLDPFNIGGWLRKDKKNERFWEHPEPDVEEEEIALSDGKGSRVDERVNQIDGDNQLSESKPTWSRIVDVSKSLGRK